LTVSSISVRWTLIVESRVNLSHLPPGYFFGRNLRTWSVGAFTLSESQYAPATNLARHAHSRAYFCLVVQGGYRETCGTYERECIPSTVVAHPAGERHSNQFVAASSWLFRVEVDDGWLTKLGQCGAGFDAPAEAHGGPLSQIATRLFRESRTRDTLTPLMIEALMLELAVGMVRRRDDRGPEWLPRVEEYLHAHFAEPLRLDDLARTAGVHPSHLSRVFRARHGSSIGEYARRLRVERASRELATTKTPIAEIAASGGFADQSHFSRVFARITGMTPAMYRRLHQ